MAKITDRTGQIFNHFQILEELGKGKVIAKCLLCNSVKEYNKSSIVTGLVKSCNCKKFVNKTGKIFNNLQIIKELYNKRVLDRCLLCNSEKEYEKTEIVRGRTRSCGCTKYNFVEKTGQIFKELKIVEELGKGKVICTCLKCGKLDVYSKQTVTSGRVNCRNCGVHSNYKHKIVNSIEIIEFLYMGRDKNRYYKCKCNKCGEEIILTREEMIVYTCNKEK